VCSARRIDKRQLSVYDVRVIRRFRHRALKALYEDDDKRGVNADHVNKLKRILARLEQAAQPSDMALPGWRLHPLKGGLAGFWSVTVQANWRVVFRFEKGDATDVDHLDYH
jgi:proteic killer suppression protein